MLHINIVGVVTCSDNSTRMTCHVYHWISFFNSFHYHITQFHCCNVNITIQEKNSDWKKCYQFLSCIAISCPAISCLAILMVRHFDVRHFQRPRLYFIKTSPMLTKVCMGHYNFIAHWLSLGLPRLLEYSSRVLSSSKLLQTFFTTRVLVTAVMGIYFLTRANKLCFFFWGGGQRGRAAKCAKMKEKKI